MRDEWEAILEVNYWPIFHTARRVLKCLPTTVAAEVLNVLWGTAEALIVHGVTRSHDLTGTIFQRLIADRKFLATFYTRPAAAALLTGLAMPMRQRDWSSADALAKRRIGDFACGTGTLLSSAYARLGREHTGFLPGTAHVELAADPHTGIAAAAGSTTGGCSRLG